MNGFFTFAGKEFKEGMRTGRIYILLGVFVFFGITSPLLARYTNEFIALLAGEQYANMFASFISEPSWLDSWAQFFNNINQIGLITIILVFMGTVSEEKQKGTAALVATKNLSKRVFILTKFLSALCMSFIAFLFAFLCNISYTLYLFEQAGDAAALTLSVLAFTAYLFCITALVVLSSSMAKSTITSALLTFGWFFLLTILAALPKINEFTPSYLLNYVHLIAAGLVNLKDVLYSIISCVALGSAALILSLRIFKKTEL